VPITKIVSGSQTGADRGGLDAATTLPVQGKARLRGVRNGLGG